MTLKDSIDRYIAWRKAHGAKFRTDSIMLNLFVRSIDGEISCDAVTGEQIYAYLAGQGAPTRYRANKYTVLAGFYRYAISRGYVSCSPLPANEPKAPPSAPPYVFSHEELRRLFDAIDVSLMGALKLDAQTFRTLLLLLYGAGLRGREARHLTLADVDVSAAVLTIRNTKFYKSRLVPVGAQLAHVLKSYAAQRTRRSLPEGKESCFLAYRDGSPLVARTVQGAFTRLLRAAGIRRTDAKRQSPRLHSCRHSFAVHRLTAWYRQGADVQRLLPVLSTYLGHKDLSGTQVYLSMTPELLQQASLRFERYARGGNHE